MRLFFSTAFLLLLVAGSSGAAEIDLYTGEAPVATQAASDRREAVPVALEQVLQKITGLRYFQDHPLVAASLGEASDILLSFHYRNAEVTLPDGSKGDELRLVARFSQAKVDQLARSLELPQWQPDRPPLDLWVILDDGLDRRIFPVEYAYAWEPMQLTAADRGLAVNLPEPDAEGGYDIDAQLLWGGYTEDLAAGRRGGAMISAARREGVEWSVRNNLSYNGRDWTWRIQDIDLAGALSESMQQAVDQLAAANTIVASDLGESAMELEVAGIIGAEEYSRCLAYLQGLSVVDRVSVVSATRGSVVFALSLNALPQYLEAAIEQGRTLALDESTGRYRLQEPAAALEQGADD